MPRRSFESPELDPLNLVAGTGACSEPFLGNPQKVNLRIRSRIEIYLLGVPEFLKLLGRTMGRRVLDCMEALTADLAALSASLTETKTAMSDATDIRTED